MSARHMLLGVLLVLASCTRHAGPVVIPDEELPLQLARSATPSARPSATALERVYYVRDGRLISVGRRVSGDVSSSEAVVRALLEGPNMLEENRGIETAIPASTRILSVGVDGTLAVVDLSGEFETPAPAEEILLRVAQIVWTVTELPEINQILVRINGAPVPIVTDRGQSDAGEPVTAFDYGSVSPVR